jgi:hypothetical protein
MACLDHVVSVFGHFNALTDEDGVGCLFVSKCVVMQVNDELTALFVDFVVLRHHTDFPQSAVASEVVERDRAQFVHVYFQVFVY